MRQINKRIIVEDNFFDKKTLNSIHYELMTNNFTNRMADYGNVYGREYFQVKLNPTHHIAQLTMKNLRKLFNLKCTDINSQYVLTTKHSEAKPHCDFLYEFNCLVYLKGNSIINNGTGFYDKINNNYQLNTHIGFKENRAIIFDPLVYHSSLQWNEDAGPRYAMLNFVNLIKKNKK
jgi:hypothetical protein|tara:strand:+ start:3261 stop:3788 length:528 start_codon:yes stop_codon:yes gene_type:complete